MTFSPKFTWFIVAAVIVLNLTVGGASLQSLRKSKQRYVENAITIGDSHAHVLEQIISGILMRVDMGLLNLTFEIEKQLASGRLDPIDIENHLALMRRNLPEIDGIQVVNANGDEVLGLQPGKTKISVADRDYFKSCRDNKKQLLVISKPLIGGHDGQWFISLARRVNKPDGAFGGIVFARFPLKNLYALISSTKVGEHSTVALRDGTDFELAVKYPDPDWTGRAAGNDVIPQAFLSALKTNKNSGHYDDRSSSGSSYTWCYSKFDNGRYYIHVGLAKDDYLAGWDNQVERTLLFFIIFSAITITSGAGACFSQKRELAFNESLKASEARFQTVFDESPIIMALCDVQTWAYVDINRRGCEYCGILKEAAIGLRPDEIGLLPIEEFQRVFAEFNASGAIDQAEVNCRNNNDEPLLLLLSARTIVISGKQYALAVLQDITTKKQAETALKRSEEQYQNIFKNAPVGIFQCDISARYLTINPTYADIFGYATPAEMMAEVPDILTQLYADPAHRVNILQRLKEEHYTVYYDLATRRKDGSRIYIDFYIRMVRDPNGKFERFEGFVLDMTQRQKLMNDLLEREERMSIYLSRLPLGCILWDPNYRVVHWNPAAESIFGYTTDEAIGKHANELIVPEWSQPHVDAVWKQLLNGELGAHSVNDNITKDGRTIVCDWVNTSFNDSSGQISGVISMVQDITERKKTEEIIIQSEKMAMVAGMAAGVAHEVNNPLGIITQGLQIMERRLSPELQANCRIAEEFNLDLLQVNRYLQHRSIFDIITDTRTAVKRASSIISSMLKFSRQSETFHQYMDINEIIEQSIRLANNDFDLRKNFDFKKIIITRNFAKNLPSIPLNLTEIEQVFINLLKNSAQAMSEAKTGSPAIEIQSSSNSTHVIVTVKDNGPGMSEAVRRKIFDPFFTTKDVGLGTGLGLSVSHAIITKNHGGELTAQSQLGLGACFVMKLPIEGTSI